MVTTREELLIRATVEDDASSGFRRIGREVEDFGRKADRAINKAERETKEYGRTAVRDLGRVERAQASLSKSLIRFGAVAGSVFLGYRLAVAGVRNATRGGFGFVNAASDFEETLAKFQVVFGDFASSSAAQIEAFAEAANRSSAELVGFASGLQDTFVPFGFAREQAATLSVELSKLAVDVASFNNSADADVLRDFQSALVGNTETVRKYGIVASQAAIEQEAFNLGLFDGNSEITAQQKLLGILSLIVKGSSDAIGDAERTSGSFANTVKGLQAEIQSLSILFGRQLQREIVEAIDSLGGLEGVVDLIKIGFGAATGVSKQFIAATRSLAEAAQSVFRQLGDVDDVANALAGNIDAAAVSTDTFRIALEGLAGTAGAVFRAISDSAELAALNVATAFKQALTGGPETDASLSAEFDRLTGEIAKLQRLQARSPSLSTQRQIEDLQRQRVGIIERQRELVAAGQRESAEFAAIWSRAFQDIQVIGVDSFAAVRESIKSNLSDSAQDLTLDISGEVAFNRLIEQARVTGDAVAQALSTALTGVPISFAPESSGTGFGLRPEELAGLLPDSPGTGGAGGSGGVAEAARVSFSELRDGVVGVFERGINTLNEDVRAYLQSREGILNSSNFGGGVGLGAQDELDNRTFGRIGARTGAAAVNGFENALTDATNALIEGENAITAFGSGLQEALKQILIQAAVQAATRGLFGGFAQGGRVPSPRYYAGGAFGSTIRDPRDVVPALLRPDEYVLRPEVARGFSGGALDRFNTTGDVGALSRDIGQRGAVDAAVRAPVGMGSIRQTVNLGGITVSVSGGSSGGDLDREGLAREITAAIERGIRGANQGLVSAVRQAAGRRPS